jgi:membrane-bound lytic murein transglycosylase D
MRRSFGLPAAAVMVTVAALGCGSRSQARLPAAEPLQTGSTAQSLSLNTPADPVAALIASSDEHFAAGERELGLGHLEQARREFDRALDVLLAAPYGARSEPRVRDHFDRLVDRISALEILALSTGDGFTEKAYEPASIDELLAISLFAQPGSATPALTEAVEADLAAMLHDVPIPLNAKVLAYVELFQGRLRDWVETGLRRGTRYLPMIQSVFRAEGLPLDLAYVPLIESAFKPNAVSRAQAKGVWQFMKGTALENGLRHDWYIDERADPEKATHAAAKYLRTLNRMFNGDWHLTLASYNGGPGRVQRALKRAGTNDFWALTRTAEFLPRETREYVPMILAAIVIARNPAQYGFDIVPYDPIEYDKVRVPRAVDLRRVAEWTGSSIGEVQALNPELRRWTTPIRYPDYEVKVPVGTGPLLEQRLSQASPTELTALKWHTVRRGETLATVARQFQVKRSDLAEANNLGEAARLRIGQSLLIPRAPAPAMARRLDRPAPATAVVSASRDVSGASSPARATSGTNVARLVHEVKQGDTLYAIARLYRTTVDQIKLWNQLVHTRINPGDQLTIYASRAR